jgi:hypothetical protein
MAQIGDMVGYPSVSSPPCSCTKIGKRATAEFAKQMLQMPGVVSSLPPLAADASHMAKTDDNFHLKCPIEFARGDYPRLTLAARRPPNPYRLGAITAVVNRGTSIELLMRLKRPIDSRPFRIPYVLRPLVGVPYGTSKTFRSLLLAVCSSTINELSEYILKSFQ